MTAAPNGAELLSLAERTLGGDVRLPASLLQKQALEQVFLTDYMAGPAGAVCTCAAQLPLAHARFSRTASPYHDPALIAETARQVGVVAATQVLDVPPEHRFLLRELSLELTPLSLLRREPANTRLLVVVDGGSQLKRRGYGRTAGATMLARLATGGRWCGTAQVRGAWLPDDRYAALRGPHADAPPAPSAAVPLDMREPDSGATPENTVISALMHDASARRWSCTLVVEPEDPTFFDPAVDHLPGLLLLEAMKQTATATICRTRGVRPEQVAIDRLSLSFARFAEHGAETVCWATVTGEDAVHVDCAQAATCCSGTIGFALAD